MRLITRRKALCNIGIAALSTGLASLSSGCLGVSPKSTSSGSSSNSFDLVVYGGTPAGIIAAVAAARRSAHVAIVEPTGHLGGILTSGLGVTDAITVSDIGGLARQFYLDLGTYYGKSTGTLQLVFEPHAAEAVFNEYVKSSNITVFFHRYISTAQISNTVIKSIALDDGSTISAAQWIDASYEGDLMAAAGISYAAGRENSQQYGESKAGWGASQQQIDVAPYFGDGSLIPGITAAPDESPGQSDYKIMAYTFRCCLTTTASNKVPFAQPAGYNPDRYKGLSEYLQTATSPTLDQIVAMQPTVNDKYCLLANDLIPFSTDYVGGAWNYPDGSLAQRSAILQDHYDYVAGFLYFVSNDSSVPSAIRSAMQQFGLPLDEFTDNQHWPWQMYVREARRLIGQNVMTQAEVSTHSTQPDSIGLGNWGIDSHLCDAFAANSAIMLDGYFFTVKYSYQIPYRCLLPKASQAANLAVTCCPSSSHIGFSSLRVEPVFMTLGHAAGVAASLALEAGTGFSEVSVSQLQTTLLNEGAILSI
jgi:hypothetical protein